MNELCDTGRLFVSIRCKMECHLSQIASSCLQLAKILHLLGRYTCWSWLWAASEFSLKQLTGRTVTFSLHYTPLTSGLSTKTSSVGPIFLSRHICLVLIPFSPGQYVFSHQTQQQFRMICGVMSCRSVFCVSLFTHALVYGFVQTFNEEFVVCVFLVPFSAEKEYCNQLLGLLWWLRSRWSWEPCQCWLRLQNSLVGRVHFFEIVNYPWNDDQTFCLNILLLLWLAVCGVGTECFAVENGECRQVEKEMQQPNGFAFVNFVCITGEYEFL